MSGGVSPLAARFRTFHRCLGLCVYVLIGIFAVVASAFSASDSRDVHWPHPHGYFLHLVGFSILYRRLSGRLVIDRASQSDQPKGTIPQLV